MAMLMTEKELCEFLKCGRTTVWKMRHAGMPYIRFGNSLRYDFNAVISWFETQKDGEGRAFT